MYIMPIGLIILQLIAACMAIICIRKIRAIAWLFIILTLSFVGLKNSSGSMQFNLPLSLLPETVACVMIAYGIYYGHNIFKQFKENITRLRFLRDIDHVMLSSLSNKGVMNAIVDKLKATINADAAAVLTIKNDSRHLNTVVSYNLSKKLQKYMESSSNGFVSSVIDNRKPLIISKIAEDEDEAFLTTLRDEGFFSYMCSPIITKGGMPIGVLTFYSERPRRYTKREVDFISAISDQIALTLDRTQLLGRIHELGFESVRALVEAIEIRDSYTRGHSVQVADLATAIASTMGFSERELTLMEFAGLLHDIGKIAVPKAVLDKQEKLTAEEWEVIKRHPSQSVKIIEPVNNLRPIQNWILHHHERWDGTGYPSGRKGKEIPLQSRILAVCDTYSAMIGDRPYRKGLDIEKIRKELKRVAGTQLDPTVVDIFLNMDLSDFNKKSLEKIGGQLRLPLNGEKVHTQPFFIS